MFVHTVNHPILFSQLFQRERTHSPHPHELLRIFRFPSGEGREVARAAELIEQTLKIVMRHVESGMIFNLTSEWIDG